MNTSSLLPIPPLILLTASACASAGAPTAPQRTAVERRLENSVMAQLIVERMERQLSYPRLLVGLDWAIEGARRRLIDEGASPRAVQDWLMLKTRRTLPGRQRIWKTEVNTLDSLAFPEHMLGQPELAIATVVHRNPAGRIVVMVVYGYDDGDRSVELADGQGPHRTREVAGREILAPPSVISHR